MATPSNTGSAGRIANLHKKLTANRNVYYAFLLLILAATIVLMVVPAIEITNLPKDPPTGPVVLLDTTFSTLVSIDFCC